jgi:hypothetical protein
MKNKDEDIDNIDFSEKAFKKRFKPIERPAFLDKALKGRPKRRISIYLDADIIDYFKGLAKKEDAGY